MKEGYIIRDQSKAHYLTATVVDWIDIFTRKIYRDCIIESLKYNIKNKKLIVFGYVIMSNHIHMIIQAEDENLSDVLRDFKKFTSSTILKMIQTESESRKEWMLDRFKKATRSHCRNKNFQFWQYGNHAEEIYTEKFLWSKLDYIHFNPVRAGIVNNAQNYIYSSASNYILGKGLMDVTLVDVPVTDTLKSSNFKRDINYE